RSAGPGNGTDARAQQRAADHQPEVLFEVLPSRQLDADTRRPDRLLPSAIVLNESVDDLRHGKERDHRHEEIDTLLQGYGPERQPLDAVDLVQADGHDHQAEDACDDAAQERFFRQAADRGQTEKNECEDFRRPELEGELGNDVHRDDHQDRKSTRLNSSYVKISYAVF